MAVIRRPSAFPKIHEARDDDKGRQCNKEMGEGKGISRNMRGGGWSTARKKIVRVVRA